MEVMGWHPADIKAELEKRGLSLADLARQNGLAPSSLRNVFRARCPKYERIVADAIGVNAEELWPERYAKKIA